MSDIPIWVAMGRRRRQSPISRDRMELISWRPAPKFGIVTKTNHYPPNEANRLLLDRPEAHDAKPCQECLGLKRGPNENS